LTCREKPISVSSLRTLLGLIEWPMAASCAHRMIATSYSD
jgi:hypothetical protein